MKHLLALSLSSLLATAGRSQLVINEVGIAPSGGNGSQFTELYNRSGCAINLSCYTLVFSSTSSSGSNATGWTIKLPSGKLIAPGGYFLIGGTAGTAGVAGTGYPTGGAVNSYIGTADVNVGTAAFTANAVYMKQGLGAGSFPNTKGQLSLLDAGNNMVAAVSYNNGNNAGTYPLSAYITCNTSGNTQGANNIPNPGAATSNIMATFSAATNQGIYLNAAGAYQTETTLSPGASNTANGGTQICSGPTLTAISGAAVCFSNTPQTATLNFTASNSPSFYNISWDALPVNSFSAITNAGLSGGNIPIPVPAHTAPAIYTGHLTLLNACGSSCTQTFTLTVNPGPVVYAGAYSPVCSNSPPVLLTGSPAGGSFSGVGVTGSSFVPPAMAGSYTILYSYMDNATGCTGTTATSITVSNPVSTYTTACTATTPYLFSGQPLTTTGLHTVLTHNAAGCTDTARIYLVVRKEVTIDTTGCNSVIYQGQTYSTATSLIETVSSTVTNCDSLVRTINITIKKATIKDTAACIPAYTDFTIAGQTFTASGDYILHTTNALGCDSAIHLHLIKTQTETTDTSECNSVVYNGITYTSSAMLVEHLPGSISSCDSIIRTVNIHVRNPTSSETNVCLAAGQTCLFNGQVYTASGHYSAILTNTQGCDSVANLHLLVTTSQTRNLNGCGSVVHNGVTYTASTVIYDTIKSGLYGCDSVITRTNITIHLPVSSYLTTCATDGDTYNFNGQQITTTGSYLAHLQTVYGCDSIAELHIVFRKTVTQLIQGCDSVSRNGQVYYTTTFLLDTIRSTVTGCDSLIYVTKIQINTKPSITTSVPPTICRGDSVTLLAASTGKVSWVGFGTGTTVSVMPLVTTSYTVSATDANGCTNTASVTVIVKDFQLLLFTAINPVLSGKRTTITSGANLPYQITGWEPAPLFINQSEKMQSLFADTSVTIKVIARAESGCKDTAYLHLAVIPLDDIYVPSAFTPNNDNRNETVRPAGTGVQEADFKIFNRWGQLVFYTTDKYKGWDGMFMGRPQPAGTYVYVVKVKKLNGKVIEKKGTITLIK